MNGKPRLSYVYLRGGGYVCYPHPEVRISAFHVDDGAPHPHPDFGVTVRQWSILYLWATGETIAQTALILGIRPSAVEKGRTQLYRKFGKDQAGAVIDAAWRAGTLCPCHLVNDAGQIVSATVTE